LTIVAAFGPSNVRKGSIWRRTRATTGTPYVDLLVETGLVKSKGEARRTINEGGAYLNNERVSDVDLVPAAADLLDGGWLVVRRGKKQLRGVQLV
jgi:tyrosyl-tRNA synthetase